MGALSFTVGLVDRMSGPAHAAAGSVGDLTSKLTSAKGALANYQSQLGRARGLGDIEGFRKYGALVDSAKRNVFDLTSAVEGMAPATSGATTELEAMGEVLGPIGAGLGVVAAVGGVVVGTLVSLTIAASKLALEQVGLKNRTLAAFDALGEGPKSGAKTLAMLDDLSSKLPQTRDQLSEWTKKLEAMGVTDLGQIKSQLLATASAQALLGNEGAQAYQSLTKRIQEAVQTHTGLKLADKQLASLALTGANVADVAKQMGLGTKELRDQLKAGSVDAGRFGTALESALIAKGKGPLDAMANSLDVLEAKGHEVFGKLFENVNVEPLGAGIRGLIGILDQGKPSGQAMEAGITGGLNGVIKVVGRALVVAKHFFLQVEIGALRTYIALKPAIREFQKLTKDTDGAQLDKQMRSIADAVTIIAVNAARAISALSKIYDLGQSGNQAGAQLGNGLVTGMEAKKASVIDAAKGLGAAAYKGLKGYLGIQSPARLTVRAGGFTGEGLAMGIRGKASAVANAGVHLGARAGAGLRLGARLGGSAGLSASLGSGLHAGLSGGFGGRASLGAGYTARHGDGASFQARARGFAHIGASLGKGDRPAADAHGGGGKRVEIREVHVHAAAGITDATEVTATGLAMVFERLANTQGL